MDTACCKLCCVSLESDDSQDAYSPLPSSRAYSRSTRLTGSISECYIAFLGEKERDQPTLKYMALTFSFHIQYTKQTTEKERGKEMKTTESDREGEKRKRGKEGGVERVRIL